MAAPVSSPMARFAALSPDDQNAVKWGIWVLEGMHDELGFSDRLISTNPSSPTIDKAIQLFEANGRNVTPAAVKTEIHDMKAGLDAVHCGLSGRYSWSTESIMRISPLTRDILGAVLKANGHADVAEKLNNRDAIYADMIDHKTKEIYAAVMKMLSNITS